MSQCIFFWAVQFCRFWNIVIDIEDKVADGAISFSNFGVFGSNRLFLPFSSEAATCNPCQQCFGHQSICCGALLVALAVLGLGWCAPLGLGALICSEHLLCVALRALSLMTACLQASQQLGHCE